MYTPAILRCYYVRTSPKTLLTRRYDVKNKEIVDDDLCLFSLLWQL